MAKLLILALALRTLAALAAPAAAHAVAGQDPGPCGDDGDTHAHLPTNGIWSACVSVPGVAQA